MQRIGFATALVVACCLILALFGCEKSTGTQPTDTPDIGLKDSAEQCEAGIPADIAEMPSGYYQGIDGDEDGDDDGEASRPFSIITTGQAITPAGQSVLLDRFPWGLAVSADGNFAFISTGAGSTRVQVVNLNSMEVREQYTGLPTEHGVAIAPDGSKYYVPGQGARQVHVFRVNTDKISSLSQADPIEIPDSPSTLAVSPDGTILYVASAATGRMYKVSTDDGSQLAEFIHVGHTPYDIVVSADGATAYISNWGGGDVAVVDTASFAVTNSIDVGKNPEGLALAEGGAKLMVTVSDEDKIVVIDTTSGQIGATIELDPDNPELKAWAPNAIAVHPDSDVHRAFVAAADHNAIEVIDTQNMTVLGSIPTGWYPVAVKVTPDGQKLAILNAKGWGYLNPGDTTSREMFGTLQLVDIPANATELEVYTREVAANTDRPGRFFPNSNCENQVPLPLSEDEKSVIEHIIVVVKENKTYDEVLGDLAGETGDEWHDPEYAIYGMNRELLNGSGERADITPNNHLIANTWIDFVNFYGDAEVSLQGHMWTTQADCNDWVEKNHFNRVPATGVDPSTIHYNKSIFDHLDKNNVSFRVYGEAVNFAFEELEKWRDRIDLKYPFWTNGITDQEKAARIIHEWDLSVETGEKSLFPQFIYIVLPNDHTYGSSGGAPHPQYMVADNDAGLGMLVEWLSKSPYWDKTLMFVLQDDPQSPVGDHVDAHRTPFFAIGPWIKRGYRSTVHYSIPSMYRTIELIFGIPAMNKNTLLAPPMIDIFTDEADTTAYAAIPIQFLPFYNPEEGKFAEEAKKYDWSSFDGHDGLGDLTWRYMFGDKPRPAGAKRIDD